MVLPESKRITATITMLATANSLQDVNKTWARAAKRMLIQLNAVKIQIAQAPNSFTKPSGGRQSAPELPAFVSLGKSFLN